MISFLKILFQIGWQIIVNYFFYRKNLREKFIQALIEADETLTAKDVRRMKFFSIFIPIMLGYGFGLIRGKKMNSTERLTIMEFSAATPLFDDFFDDENLDVNHLQQIFEQKENYQPQNSKEKLFFEILLLLKPKIYQQEQFVDLCYAIFIAQKAALKQTSIEKIDFEELKTISFAKCSASSILFWSLLKDNFTQEEKTVVIQVGNLIQLTDDIFDLWFDWKDGTQTLATNTHSIFELEKTFSDEWKKLVHGVELLPINNFNKNNFLKLQWFFFSRTYVAFEQLKKLTIKNNQFNPKDFSRKELVCDMELWSNRIKWINFYKKIKNKKPHML